MQGSRKFQHFKYFGLTRRRNRTQVYWLQYQHVGFLGLKTLKLECENQFHFNSKATIASIFGPVIILTTQCILQLE